MTPYEYCPEWMLRAGSAADAQVRAERRAGCTVEDATYEIVRALRPHQRGWLLRAARYKQRLPLDRESDMHADDVRAWCLSFCSAPDKEKR